MVKAKLVSRLVEDIVIREVVRDQRSLVFFRQVAKLGLELQAAAGQQARRNGRIVIRRDIPVDRQSNLVAAAAHAANLRRQESRLARIADRKRDIGQVQYGNALETQAHVLCRAGSLARVEHDRPALQQPVFRTGWAGRVLDPAEHQLAVAVDLEFLCCAARIAAAERKLGAFEADTPEVIAEFGRLA